MENSQNIQVLFSKFLNRNCNEEELQRLFVYFDTSDESRLRELIRQELWQQEETAEELTLKQTQDIQVVLESIRQKIALPEKKVNRISKRLIYYASAAAVLLFFGIGLYFNYNNLSNDRDSLSSKLGGDAMPPSNKATLILSSGEKVELGDSLGTIVNNDQGISYANGNNIKKSGENRSATLVTPVGGQYQMILADGTKVWLNALSSVRYPLKFSAHNRIIEVSGEVYLEVAKDSQRPFIVQTDNQQIEVLGTAFNINAYHDNENTKTTLVEGSLRVKSLRNEDDNVILTPGQQAVLSLGQVINVRKVNTDEVISWKDGMYVIENETLQNYAKQIERWYDVEMDMSDFKGVRFSAIIPKKAMLSEVLQAIELQTNIHFIIEGRRVKAMK